MNSDHFTSDPNNNPARECFEAVSLATVLLNDSNLDAAQYKLISAQNAIKKGPDYVGPHIWRLTFKLSSLIPDTANMVVGAGGELFVEVDMITKEARLLGYGE